MGLSLTRAYPSDGFEPSDGFGLLGLISAIIDNAQSL